MAILRSCCCGYSIRTGSFASGVYTLIYFLLFALLTGNYSYHEVMSRYFSRPVTSVTYNLTNTSNSNTNPSIPSTLLPPLNVPNVLNIFNTTNSSTIDLSDPGGGGGNSSLNISKGNGSLESDLDGVDDIYSASGDMVLILVDFTCEIIGFVASIGLLRGLQFERKSYLIPWLVIVPIHTVIDAFTVINIIILYMNTSIEPKDFYWGFVTAITVLIDLLLNLINVYVFLCVLSQYQEYVAGRGTAAHQSFRWQGPLSVRYDAGSTGPTSSIRGDRGSTGNGKRLKGLNPCFSENEFLRDIWGDDLVLDKLENTSVNLSQSQDDGPATSNSNPGPDYDRERRRSSAFNRKRERDRSRERSRSQSRKASGTPSVRFECDCDNDQRKGDLDKKGTNLSPPEASGVNLT